VSVNFPDSKPVGLFIRRSFVSWFCVMVLCSSVAVLCHGFVIGNFDVFGSHHWSLGTGGGRSLYTTAEASSERTLFNSLEFR
jgi:hypothetical protein